MRPLEGIKVLDISRLIPGSIATAHLADLGAEVLKVEVPPLGDYLRTYGPYVGSESVLFVALNRGKRSAVVDHRSSEGAATLRQLITEADVLVENSLPGTLAKHGLDVETCRNLNPGLIYCSVTAYGQSGSDARLPSHGFNVDALAGQVQLAEDAAGRPIAMAPPLGGLRPSMLLGGQMAALGVCAALVRRATTGDGCHLDASCLDAGLAADPYRAMLELNDVPGEPRSAEPASPALAVYRTRDDRLMMICAIEVQLWERFCTAIDRPDLVALRGSDAMEFSGELAGRYDEIAVIIKARSFDEWDLALRSVGVPFSEVTQGTARFETAHARSRGLVTETTIDDEVQVRLPAHPLVFDGNRAGVTPTSPPTMGEHPASFTGGIRPTGR